jgi:hypothetical protein
MLFLHDDVYSQVAKAGILDMPLQAFTSLTSFFKEIKAQEID